MRQLQLKPALGGVCLAAALALGSGCGLALLRAGGDLNLVSPLHIAALAVTAALAGAGADLIGRGPKADDDGGGVAKSVWATREHLEQFDIIERGEAGNAPYPGIYLGHALDDEQRRRLRYKKSNLHLLTFGPPGAAKSAGLLVPNLAHLRQSMIAIDVKGQLTAITARRRATFGRVIVLNPFNLFAGELPHLESNGWNPMAQLDPARLGFVQDAEAIADALVSKSPEGAGNAKFFDISAENILSLFVMFERIRKGKRASLRNVRAMLSPPSPGRFVETVQEMAAHSNYALSTGGRRLLGRLLDEDSKNTSLQDVIDTVLKDLRFLNDDRVALDMAIGGPIDWAALHREVTTIYLILPTADLDPQGMGKWLRLFVNLALRGLYQNAPTFGGELPRVLFLLDEFAQLGRLQEIPKALGAARDYAISLWFVLQNLAQLKTHYPKEWPLFFTGAGVKTSFRAGDLETAEYFSKLIGNSERFIMTENHTGGSSLTPHAIPLIRPEDLLRVPAFETVNLIDPCPFPVRAEVPIYTATAWAGDLDPNPYYRG